MLKVRWIYTAILVLVSWYVSIGQVYYKALDDIDIKEALSIIEDKNALSFSYDSERLSGILVSIEGGEYSLQKILEAVLNGTQFTYEILDGSHILLIEKTSKKGRLCGYLKDKKGGEAILFATVLVDAPHRWTYTDESGYFEIEGVALGKEIEVSYLGYESFLFTFNGEDCPTYFLTAETYLFEPIVLTEFLSDGISQTANASTIVIEPEAMNVLPGSVEKDVLAAIQFLPGISSPSEGLDAVNIRGGTPDQNLVLFDGIPMYHTSHLFGSISVFNPRVIDKVDVHRSSISSEFGGRVSGVIDMKSVENVDTIFHTGVGFNLTHLHIDSRIPLWKNSSLVFSARRSITDIGNTATFNSYIDKVFQGTRIEDNNFNDPDLQFSDKFKFNDATLKWLWKPGKNEFSVSLLGALNNLNYKAELDNMKVLSTDFLDLRNGGVGLLWKRKWNKNFGTEMKLTSSDYDYNYNLSYKLIADTTGGEAPVSIDSRNRISDGGFSWINNYKINKNQKVKFGYQFTNNKIALDIRNRYFSERDTTKERFENRLHALFGQYTLELPKLLHLEIGLRQQYSRELDNAYFEPRISLITDVSEAFKLKAGTSKLFQFVSQLVVFDNNELGLNNQIWIASNNTQIPVIESNQWMSGFIYKKGKWTLDVESYVKEIEGITTLSSNFADLPDQPFSIGKSRIRGIDILLKRRINRYHSWLSYTLSKSSYEFLTLSAQSVPATFDQRHTIQWVHIFKTGKWEYSLGLNARSGLPSTGATGVDTRTNNQGNEVSFISYGNINEERLLPYRRIDASVIYNFGKKSEFNGFLAFSIQNLTNRTNILGKQYLLSPDEETGESIIIEQETRGLRFTPNFSANVRF